MFRKRRLKTLFKKTLKDKFKDEIRELAHQIKQHFDHKRLVPVTVSGPRIKKR